MSTVRVGGTRVIAAPNVTVTAAGPGTPASAWAARPRRWARERRTGVSRARVVALQAGRRDEVRDRLVPGGGLQPEKARRGVVSHRHERAGVDGAGQPASDPPPRAARAGQCAGRARLAEGRRWAGAALRRSCSSRSIATVPRGEGPARAAPYSNALIPVDAVTAREWISWSPRRPSIEDGPVRAAGRAACRRRPRRGPSVKPLSGPGAAPARTRWRTRRPRRGGALAGLGALGSRTSVVGVGPPGVRSASSSSRLDSRRSR